LQVFEEYREFKDQYGDLSTLPTLRFLKPLEVGEEFSFELEQGKKLIISLVAIGSLNETSRKRDVFFYLNGEARVVSIDDEISKTANAALTDTARTKVDPKDKYQIGVS
jgi:pyruvate carboxylase